jgi:hypothetical protein
MGLLAAALGWVVTDVSCEGSCTGWAALWAVVAFVAVTAGVALVLVLVYRSLAEWREKSR